MWHPCPVFSLPLCTSARFSCMFSYFLAFLAFFRAFFRSPFCRFPSVQSVCPGGQGCSFGGFFAPAPAPGFRGGVGAGLVLTPVFWGVFGGCVDFHRSRC